MRATLVHNPTAGDGKVGRQDLIRILTRAGLRPCYQSSKVGELSAALAAPADLVVVAGGDGTVTKVLAQMPSREVPIAILPMGTANNIATSLGIGGPLDRIAAGLINAEKRRLDLALARGPWGRCRVVEGIGLGALVRAADRIGKPEGDRATRLDAARRCVRKILKDIEPDRVQIRLDDEPLPHEHLMVEVLNIACGGPRLALAPDVDPGDGKLDVIMLEPAQRKDMRRWLDHKQPHGHPPLRRWRGSRVSMLWDGTPLHIDDDLPELERGPALVELEVESSPATLLVPPSGGLPGDIE